MSTTNQDIVTEWTYGNDTKQNLTQTSPDFILRWMNQAALRFCDKSEILRSVWTTTTASDGTATLPADFLREIPDRILISTTQPPLQKVAYEDAINIIWGSTVAYSIYNGKLQVWGNAAVSITVPYIQKPTTITTLASDSQVPTEYHQTLKIFLDSLWARYEKDISSAQALLDLFDEKCSEHGMSFILRRYRHPKMRSNFF